METKNQGHLYKKDYKVDFSNIPLSEYPRPNLVRDSYLCLNGKWDLHISDKQTLPKEYSSSINVPYAIESPLSRVNRLIEPNEFIYYRRIVSLDDSFKDKKIIIHFEGVDQICKVYINGAFVKENVGGYTPFTVELDYLPSFELVLKVQDVTDESYYSRGKQVLSPTGWFYSSSSGVYKPIWLEGVKENYIKDVKFYPDVDKKELRVKIKSDLTGIAHLFFDDRDHVISTNKEEIVKFEDIKLWSIDNPHLYQARITFKGDEVKTYFAFRKIEIKEDKNEVKRIYLNDEKIFLTGLLDQGYYYLGNLTPASYADYEKDIIRAKELGFNCLRVHIKIENEIFYYYADKLGMLLIQDFPCGGSHYKFINVVAPRVFPFLKERVLTYSGMGRSNADGRKEFIQEAFNYMKMMNNHPSIIIYTIFNEGWGEFDPSKIYHLLKQKYPNKLFDTASGWYDAQSDFYSIHTYTFPNMHRKDKKRRAFVLSEIGGLGLKVKDHSEFSGYFSHGKCQIKKELELKYSVLFRKKIMSQIKKRGLNMVIYTELNDCETEYNGIYTFDREVLKIDKDLIIKINSELKEELKKID